VIVAYASFFIAEALQKRAEVIVSA
jgi:hypothetical protein